MIPLVPTKNLSSESSKGENTGEILDEFARFMGLDPEKLPDAAQLPPWTDEEAAEFKRLIYEACKGIDDTPLL